MKKHSENDDNNWETLRQKVIGLGETSVRKNHYAELQNRFDELERFRFLLDSTEESLLVAEIPCGKLIDVNRSATNLFGYSKDEFLLMNINDLLEEQTLAEIKDFSHNSSNRNKYQNTFSSTIKTKDIKEIPVEISIDSARFASKFYLVILIRNITERIKAERLKSEFLAQVSHEIRTPVNTILNYLSLVKEELKTDISDELTNSFKAIDNGSRRLIKTIDSLINMSQIQTGNYDFKPSIINLEKDVIENIIIDHHYQVKSKGIKIGFQNETGSPAIIKGDIFSITQIFSNLVDNAVKFTHLGDINIRLYTHDHFLCADISDTGIGISEEYMPYLFEPFSQEDTGYTRRFDGNGLGLALVMKYAEMNNIKISVKSKKGEGTTFMLCFRTI